MFRAGSTLASSIPSSSTAVGSPRSVRRDAPRYDTGKGKITVVTLRRDIGLDRMTIGPEGIGGPYHLWPDVGPQQLDACGPRDVAHIRWSEPAPVGTALRIDAVERTGACSRLSLVKNGAPFQWELCTGDADMPLAVGDLIDVAVSAPKPGVVDQPTIRIERHPRSDGALLRLWLGAGPVPVMRDPADPGEPSMAMTHDDRCAIQVSECGMVTIPARVDVTLAQRSLQLRAGEHMRLRNGTRTLELAVGQADMVPIAPASCEVPKLPPRFFAIDQRAGEQKRIAADPSAAK
jgi:hypothetical protein